MEDEPIGAAAAGVYERRLRKVERKRDKTHARAAMREAEQVPRDHVAALLHAHLDQTE